MPSIILNYISKPKSLTSEVSDAPLSFSEWNSRNIGISFSDAEIQYNNYVRDFYKNTEKRNEEARDKIKQDYINLIKKLQVIFKDDEEFQRYSSADLESETDLSLIIPAYAKKLKDIALFYVKKREELKNKKLEYNLVGSFEGLKKIISNNIISKFTKTEQTNFVSENPFVSISPSFSSISDDFSIEIEELYDTHDYYADNDSINPFSCIFNDLCFNLFSTPLSAKSDPIESLYICEPSNETVDQLLQKAYSKYLSTRISYVSGGYYVEDYKEISIPLETGNNFFYWFSGSTVFDLPEGIYKNTPINDLNWTGATGGSAADVSDLIFINAGNNLMQGAWLQDTNTVVVKDVMSATMNDGKMFKFPFSDYGTSAIGGSWSGPGINDTILKSRKFFPTEEDFTFSQQNVNKLYWTSFSSISVVQPLYLQESSLGKYGYASNNFDNADKIFLVPEMQSNAIYSNVSKVAWLYNFKQTQIPITVGDNKIYFPIQRYENDSDLFFNYLNGSDVALSSLDVEKCFSGAVAAENIEDADWIIKNNTICGPEIEVAWLKAVPLKLFSPSNQENCGCEPEYTTFYTNWSYVSGGAQSSAAFKCSPGETVRFVWNGETTSINKVRGFLGFDHDRSCPYKYLDHSISFENQNIQNSKNKDLFEKWKKCSCQAIYYSPFGHSSAKLNQYKILPDFIVKDVVYPKLFNKKTWIGTDGKDYINSIDSAKFYPNLIEKDLGWGSGVWKNQEGNDFVLEKGQSYIYYRSDANNCNFDSPFFIINQPYEKGTISDENCEKISYYPTWYKAIQDENNNWIDSGVVSDMILEFGDFLNYRHRSTVNETKKRLLYKGTEITTTSGEYVKLKTNDNNISFVTYTNKNDSVNFLIKIPISAENNYWGNASYGESEGKSFYKSIDSNQFSIKYDYLQITQPPPSDIVLGDKTVIQYKFGNCAHDCFIWSQDLTFDVVSPVRKWNKISFDSCVSSELLNYLNSEISNCYVQKTFCYSDCSGKEKCGCYHYCSPSKTGVSATNYNSDIILNVELSGIPVFVNYYARNSYTAILTALDITYGDKSKFVPVSFSNNQYPENPWRDLLNQKGSNFVVEEKIEYLQTDEELNFYNPKRIGMNRFETFDKRTLFSPNTSGTDVYRVDNYFDAPFGKNGSYSKYITDFSLGQRQGTPLTENKQTFIPYTNTHEKTKREFYGLYNTPLSFSPWSTETGEWKESDLYKNYRNQLFVSCSNNWYTNQLSLTSNVWNWQTDIYGNQYFVTVENLSSNYPAPSSYGKIYIKSPDGKVSICSDALSSISKVYENVIADLSDPFENI
jgi:hypothetical protein